MASEFFLVLTALAWVITSVEHNSLAPLCKAVRLDANSTEYIQGGAGRRSCLSKEPRCSAGSIL